jgi:DNA end-binding protein Ku
LRLIEWTKSFHASERWYEKAKAAAIARTVLFRWMRTVLIRAHGKGLIVSTLNFDYEVRKRSRIWWT